MSDMTGTHTRWPGGAVALLTFLCMTAPSAAQNACVSCEGPAAIYSCSVAPDENATVARRSRRALQFACIQDIARRFKHTSCSVKRNQVGNCTGQVHMLSHVQEPSQPQTSQLQTSQPQTTVAAEAQPAAENSSEPIKQSVKQPREEPRTMVELAKRTASNTQKELKRSAQSVSKAANSTWRCLSSLFADC